MNIEFKINEFEGPLDLLLHLIKESKMDIMNIEIESITKQYMDYLEEQEKLGNVIIIRPSQKPQAGRIEKDKEKILSTYNLGRNDAEKLLETVKNFIC